MFAATDALIPEPRRMNPLLRLGVRVSERITGKRMMPARLLAWYPRAAIGAGVLESLIAHDEPSPRLLGLVRITASMAVNCPFCVDMNGFGAREAGVTDAELRGLATWLATPASEPPASLSAAERVAVDYARAVSATPLSFDDDLKRAVTSHFTEREVVIVATTAAQVNYWARTIQALGIQPAGFCSRPS